MTRLKAIPPKSTAPSKPKILVYGKPGVGKTWVALDFPSVYYIDTECGADLPRYTDKLARSKGVYCGKEQGSLNFTDVVEQVKALSIEKHPYKTLVIDSITKLFANEISREAERLGDKNAFGADKKPAVALMRTLINWIQRLDMTVILIAHERPEWGVVNKQRAEIGSTFDAWDKLEYELHLSLNIIKAGHISQAIVKKSRLEGFPPDQAFQWGYGEFAGRYGKDIIEKAASQITLATPAQLAELHNLLPSATLPEAWERRCFDAANVSSYEEMDTERLDKIINAIKERYIPALQQQPNQEQSNAVSA